MKIDFSKDCKQQVKQVLKASGVDGDYLKSFGYEVVKYSADSGQVNWIVTTQAEGIDDRHHTHVYPNVERISLAKRFGDDPNVVIRVPFTGQLSAYAQLTEGIAPEINLNLERIQVKCASNQSYHLTNQEADKLHVLNRLGVALPIWIHFGKATFMAKDDHPLLKGQVTFPVERMTDINWMLGNNDGVVESGRLLFDLVLKPTLGNPLSKAVIQSEDQGYLDLDLNVLMDKYWKGEKVSDSELLFYSIEEVARHHGWDFEKGALNRYHEVLFDAEDLHFITYRIVTIGEGDSVLLDDKRTQSKTRVILKEEAHGHRWVSSIRAMVKKVSIADLIQDKMFGRVGDGLMFQVIDQSNRNVIWRHHADEDFELDRLVRDLNTWLDSPGLLDVVVLDGDIVIKPSFDSKMIQGSIRIEIKHLSKSGWSDTLVSFE